MNPLKAVQRCGQSIWLDYLRRELLTSGELQRLIEEDGLRGLTSNPSIFEKAIGGSEDYDEQLRKIEAEGDAPPGDIYERLAIEDIKRAADIMKPVYDATNRRDGYVSLEVSPYLAFDTDKTIEEARRLWREVARPNLMVKVPGTVAGVPAVRRLTSEGININITLLFARSAYEAVADAFIDGLEAFAAEGGDAGKVASVASFFVSRIDTAVDAEIDARLKDSPKPDEVRALESLKGKTAIANAKLAYQHYKELFAGPRWRKLVQKTGAQTQRLLWASTGTKNPAYSDVLYVEELIGPDTVNTIPPATMDAFRDHGRAQPRLEDGVEEARRVMAKVHELGLPFDEITRERLVADGVKQFADASDKLLGAVAHKRAAILGDKLDRQQYSLPPELEKSVKQSLEEWRKGGKVRKLWARDASLWTGKDEGKWLAWLDIADDREARERLKRLAAEVKAEGFSHALLLGMGGSSLGAEVLAKSFGRQKGFPELRILDSTDPAQIAAVESEIDIAKTLFIVSSKSGSTLEPNIFKQYFFARAEAAVGAGKAGKHFIAITDPGSKLEQVAKTDRFRHVFHGDPGIGGRYSVLSAFGMVPAAVMGLDTTSFLDRAATMAHGCAASVPPADNPGILLGTILGLAAGAKRNKVTVVASPAIADFGAWLEQLLAESTGKAGKGLIPVADEPLGSPEAYGDDRLFAYIRLDSEPDAKQDRAMDALQKAGHPVVRIALAHRDRLGQEFFRWEIATAAAGAILGINAFDQPDVEASKVKTVRLTSEYEKTGRLPPDKPLFEAEGVKLYADPRNAAALAKQGAGATLESYLKALLDQIAPGDYFALLAYIARSPAHIEALQALRRCVRDAKKVATCLGFGPRFLHSTGQLYKGGPNSGVFLQLTCDDAKDLAIPGAKYSFGTVKAAQARGDLEVLAERGRRALRVHLGADLARGLAALAKLFERALKP